MRVRLSSLCGALLVVCAIVAPVPLYAQLVPTGTIDANGESAQLLTGGAGLPAGGWATVGVQIRGTFTGTIEFQVSIDLLAWQTVSCVPTNATDTATDATDVGIWDCPTAGKSAIRAIAVAWTDGAADVFLRGSPAGGIGTGSGTVVLEGEVSAFNGVLLDAPAGDSLTDTVNNALRVNVITGAITATLSATDNAVLDDIADGIAVTGTVTAELSATDNAVLDAIAVDTAFLETSKAPVAPGAATATTAFVIGGTYNAAGVTVADTQQAGLQLDAAGNLLIASADMLSELGEIAGTLETIDGKLNVDATHGDVLKASGPQIMGEAATLGSFPSPVSALQPVRLAASPYRVLYTTPANPDGTAGCTPGSSISTAAVLETEIKATAGYLDSLVVSSVDGTPVFVKVYNLTAVNADESDTPTWRFAIGASGGGMVLPIEKGALFSTAITVRITTGGADNDTGALSANEVFLSWCVR